jgi:hypothetical protein
MTREEFIEAVIDPFDDPDDPIRAHFTTAEFEAFVDGFMEAVL